MAASSWMRVHAWIAVVLATFGGALLCACGAGVDDDATQQVAEGLVDRNPHAHHPPCGRKCRPRSTRCVDTGVETCDAHGNWGAASTCPFVCDPKIGACSGVCVPGSTRCSEQGEQVCDAKGQWDAALACPVGCDSTSSHCAPPCVPGTTQCASSTTSQVCDASGRWSPAENCQFACDSATGACTECQPNTGTCDGNIGYRCGFDGHPELPRTCAQLCREGLCIPKPQGYDCVRSHYDLSATGEYCRDYYSCGMSGKVCSPDSFTGSFDIQFPGPDLIVILRPGGPAIGYVQCAADASTCVAGVSTTDKSYALTADCRTGAASLVVSSFEPKQSVCWNPVPEKLTGELVCGPGSVNVPCSTTCTPGTTVCFGNAVQQCTADGHWLPATPCTGTCVDGSCI